jgi:hypothetical protein
VLRSAMRKSLKGLGGFPTLNRGFILGPSARHCGSAFLFQVTGDGSQVTGKTLRSRDAVTDQEESREEWEQEIRDVQRSITFAEGLRASQIIAKRASVSPAPIKDVSHLVRFVLSPIFLALGFVVFLSSIPYKIVFGVAFLVLGSYLGVAAFRGHSSRG